VVVTPPTGAESLQPGARDGGVHCVRGMTLDRIASTTLALALLAPLGCDDDSDDDVDAREAEIGWTATNRAMASGHDDFAAQVELTASGDLQATCAGGGSMYMVGRMNEVDDFRLDVEFDECVADDVMIDGSVTLVASVDVDVDIDGDDGDHAGAAVDWDGDLVLSGDVEGTCSIDASVRAGALVFDDFAAAGVTVEGHICDHDAELVVHGEAHVD
jgi:hypothetical protein